jgi:hypothetical protein
VTALAGIHNDFAEERHGGECSKVVHDLPEK